MKKFILIFFVVALAFISFEFCTTNETSAKGKKGKAPASIQVFSNDGEQIIYGSILIPTADDANVALPPDQLAKVRKAGVSKLTVTLTSTVDSTKTYTVPTESVTVQSRKLKKKSGKFLVVNLFSITNQSGITVSPSSLPGDQYKLTISDGKDIDITTGSFKYEPPALVVGTAKTKSTGVVTVEDLEGDMISDKSVITSNNGAFFTEVRAKNLPSNSTSSDSSSNSPKKKRLLAQTEDESDVLLEDDTEPGVVAVNIDEDKEAELEALVPLSTDPDANEAISENEAIEVTEETTQELDYLKEAAEGDAETLEEIADQAVKQKLDDITGSTSTSSSGGLPTPTNCPDVKLLANRCNNPDAALGNDVKSTYFSVCDFDGKEFIEKLPLEKIAKVYCEHATKGEEKGSPCDVYEKFILPNAKGPKPVCPPPECTKFASILKNCVQPFGVCGGPQGGPGGPTGPGPITRLAQVSGPSPGNTPGGPGQCFVKKPPRDLFCFEIDVKDGVPASECIPDPTNPGPDWTIGDAGNGKKFCVPSKLQGGFLPPGGIALTTPNDIAKQLCVLTRCHKDCEIQLGKPSFTGLEQAFGGSTAGGPGGPGSPGGGFGFPQDCKVCKCHQICEAKNGRPVCDFGFGIVTKGCCTNTTFAAQQFGGFGGGMGGFGGPGPIPPGGDLRSCLCKDLTANFGSDNVATDAAVESCKKSCPDPDKYEPGKLSSGQEVCLPICEKFGQGLVRDEGGGCKKGKGGQDNCPASCSQFVRKFLEQTTGGTQPPGFGGSFGDIPPECKPCFGGGQCPPDKPVKCPDGLCKPSQAECGKGECPPDQKFDPVTQKCIGQQGPCPLDKPIRCFDGSCKLTQLECGAGTSSGGACLPGQFKCPDGKCVFNQTECGSTTCPQDKPIKCPDGSCRLTQLECGAGTSSGGACPQATPIRCPDGSCRVTQLECGGTSTSSSGGGTCPQATPIRCPDGSCKVTQLECGGTSTSSGGGGTCPQATPIRCPDNSCQATQAACPCPAGQTKCSDGTCQTTCPCPQATPIRCPDNSCQATQAACPCPAGQTKCSDGTCQITCPQQGGTSSGGGQNCPAGNFFCSASNTCKPTGSPCP